MGQDQKARCYICGSAMQNNKCTNPNCANSR